MSITKRRNPAGRCLGGRHRPSFDRLEARTLLSGSPVDPGFSFNPPAQFGTPADSTSLSISSTTPSSSSILTVSPQSLVVTFNKPLSGFSIGLADFALFHVNADGTTSPLSQSGAQLQESLNLTNPAGNQIDLTLSSLLAAGQYRLVLTGSNRLAGTDGSLIASNGQDLVVSDFSIVPKSTGLQAATNLETIGSTIVESSGSLNLGTDPGSVNYYQLTLAPGHRWSLGLAVNSVSQNSPLATTLSLFNSQGKLIKTDSTGLLTNPGDPYLFAGLDPGTYYVGVSARGNVPGADGTYNLNGSSNLNLGTDPQGGAYQLQAVANTADSPTQVLGVRLDQADPASTTLTGLTLQFSGAIQIAGLEQPSVPPLELVDQSGTVWGVTTVGYDPGLGQLHLVFDQALPAGSYTLELTNPGSLVDLADAVPVAKGLSLGQLAGFSVSSTSGQLPSGDLGPLYPGAQSSTAAAALRTAVTVGPQSSVTEHFVVIEPGVYAIEGVSPAIGLTYTLTDAKGTFLASGPQDSFSGETDLALKAGSYTLTITNPTASSVETPVIILHKVTVFSELMEGGISQGAALSLRLVAPPANFGTVNDPLLPGSNGNQNPGSGGLVSNPPTSSPPATPTPSNPGSTSVATSDSGQAAMTQASTSAVPSTIFSASAANLLFGFGPAGLPSSQASQISVVGSTGAGGSLALASNSPTLNPGLIGIPESVGRRERMERHSNRGVDEPIPEPIPELAPEAEMVPEDLRVSTTEAGVLAGSPQSRRADDRSLAAADWIGTVVSRTIGWVGERTSVTESVPQASVEGPLMSALPDRGLLAPESGVETASMIAPIGVGVVLMWIGYRFRKSFRIGSKGRLKLPLKISLGRKPIIVGPHRRVRRQHAIR